MIKNLFYAVSAVALLGIASPVKAEMHPGADMKAPSGPSLGIPVGPGENPLQDYPFRKLSQLDITPVMPMRPMFEKEYRLYETTPVLERYSGVMSIRPEHRDNDTNTRSSKEPRRV